jgi:integrase
VGTATIAACHQILRCALKMAVRLGWVGRNVIDAVTRPRYEPKVKPVWSQEQLARFLHEAQGYEQNVYGPNWLTLAQTGMRRGEALGLRWSDADLESGTLHVAQTRVARGARMKVSAPKTQAGRRVLYLDPVLVDALPRHRVSQNERRLLAGPVWQDKDLVFCNEAGTPIHGNNLLVQYKRLCARAGVPNITIHGIRHTVATLSIGSGDDIRTVADQLGHSRTSVTVDVYSHVMPRRKKELARNMARLVLGGDTPVASSQ